MIILIHSSKTMRSGNSHDRQLSSPILIAKANELRSYLTTLTTDEIAQSMKVSAKLADQIRIMFNEYPQNISGLTPAAECFIGDIYSGLQVRSWDEADWDYAGSSLRILSGLYGILRPNDGVSPYRLEMAYRLPKSAYRNLYAFWGTNIADSLPKGETLLNLAADEYSKTITPCWDTSKVLSPKFLTVSPKTGEPIFVVVHTKIARGAFASWAIKNRIADARRLKEFNELGYQYSAGLSTQAAPVFVCSKFGGIGLSVRLSGKR